MTLRWVEGFEVDAATTYLTKYPNLPTANIVAGRLFGTCQRGGTLITPKLAPSPQATWVLGMGWFSGANPSAAADYVTFYNGGLEQLSIHFNSNRLWEVHRGATVLATGTTAWPNLDWGYIEFKATFHTSTGSYELRINGITELEASGINTAASGTNDVDTVAFRSISNHRWDDIYILDSTGTKNNDFLGPRAVEGSLPVADGDTLEWTPSTGMDHYVLVDDPASTPNLSDFVSSGTVGQDDLYDLSNLKYITGDINGVAVICLADLDGVATRTMRGKYRNEDDTEANGPTFTVNSTAARTYLTIMEDNPTSIPTVWTPETINDGQFGVELLS